MDYSLTVLMQTKYIDFSVKYLFFLILLLSSMILS